MKKLGLFTMFAAVSVALAACGEKKDEGGLTAADNQELNNAAEMLDASPDSLVASDDVALGNGESTALDAEANASGNGAVEPGNSE